MNKINVIVKRTGKEGYLLYVNQTELTPDRVYHTRFKGEGGGHFGMPFKGSELQIKN